eukprot:TRINITY_DN24782_c0_g1_i1.p1 TRINITY_DN24782_c0_g1~~TRINITY_DN24782_c0_g1_i1.p1  ORF type:complete len:902 (+),score=317.97 TRINITY_DN24782_c0_g1_i1:118-2823(+)
MPSAQQLLGHVARLQRMNTRQASSWWQSPKLPEHVKWQVAEAAAAVCDTSPRDAEDALTVLLKNGAGPPGVHAETIKRGLMTLARADHYPASSNLAWVCGKLVQQGVCVGLAAHVLNKKAASLEGTVAAMHARHLPWLLYGMTKARVVQGVLVEEIFTVAKARIGDLTARQVAVMLDQSQTVKQRAKGHAAGDAVRNFVQAVHLRLLAAPEVAHRLSLHGVVSYMWALTAWLGEVDPSAAAALAARVMGIHRKRLGDFAGEHDELDALSGADAARLVLAFSKARHNAPGPYEKVVDIVVHGGTPPEMLSRLDIAQLLAGLAAAAPAPLTAAGPWGFAKEAFSYLTARYVRKMKAERKRERAGAPPSIVNLADNTDMLLRAHLRAGVLSVSLTAAVLTFKSLPRDPTFFDPKVFTSLLLCFARLAHADRAVDVFGEHAAAVLMAPELTPPALHAVFDAAAALRAQGVGFLHAAAARVTRKRPPCGRGILAALETTAALGLPAWPALIAAAGRVEKVSPAAAARVTAALCAAKAGAAAVAAFINARTPLLSRVTLGDEAAVALLAAVDGGRDAMPLRRALTARFAYAAPRGHYDTANIAATAEAWHLLGAPCHTTTAVLARDAARLLREAREGLAGDDSSGGVIVARTRRGLAWLLRVVEHAAAWFPAWAHDELMGFANAAAARLEGFPRLQLLAAAVAATRHCPSHALLSQVYAAAEQAPVLPVRVFTTLYSSLARWRREPVPALVLALLRAKIAARGALPPPQRAAVHAALKLARGGHVPKRAPPKTDRLAPPREAGTALPKQHVEDALRHAPLAECLGVLCGIPSRAAASRAAAARAAVAEAVATPVSAAIEPAPATAAAEKRCETPPPPPPPAAEAAVGPDIDVDVDAFLSDIPGDMDG